MNIPKEKQLLKIYLKSFIAVILQSYLEDTDGLVVVDTDTGDTVNRQHFVIHLDKGAIRERERATEIQREDTDGLVVVDTDTGHTVHRQHYVIHLDIGRGRY